MSTAVRSVLSLGCCLTTFATAPGRELNLPAGGHTERGRRHRGARIRVRPWKTPFEKTGDEAFGFAVATQVGERGRLPRLRARTRAHGRRLGRNVTMGA